MHRNRLIDLQKKRHTHGHVRGGGDRYAKEEATPVTTGSIAVTAQSVTWLMSINNADVSSPSPAPSLKDRAVCLYAMPAESGMCNSVLLYTRAR